VGGTRPIAVNVRIISATHCDLDARVREGRFRADLYYRLGVLRLRLPALRERREDIAPLAEWHLKHALAALDARPHANLRAEIARCAAVLEDYAWPGNVRELRNVMERLALLLAAEPLQALTPALIRHLAPELDRQAVAPALPLTRDAAAENPAAEAEDIHVALQRFRGNRAAAARHLGISRTTLWRKLKEDGGGEES
jgi:propionate catabolism operon transcriptional regulator